MKKVILALCLGISSLLPQGFSVDAYKQFLSTHSGMNSQQMYELYPAGNFLAEITPHNQPILFLDSIRAKLGITPYEDSLLARHGFMVSERLNRKAFGEAFLETYHKDLPVYISADAILHAFHISYDRILLDVELEFLFPRLKLLLQSLHAKMPQLHMQYISNEAMSIPLKDADVFLTVARKLAGQTAQPYYPDNAGLIDSLMTYISGYQAAGVKLFSTQERSIDFSQFKPRGHYVPSVNNPGIENYFKCMMWLGRIELYLIAPQNTINPVKFENVQRQLIMTMLLDELVTLAGANQDIEFVETRIRFFAGDQDNVSLPNIQELKISLGVTSAAEFTDSVRAVEFQDSLKTKDYAWQKILSQILYRNPFTPDSLVPASAFMLFGQRFVIDSYVTGSVVYDRIQACRLFPSVLDPLFALGNNGAARLLEPELNQYGYSLNLAGLRYLIDQYDEDFWESSMYNGWLNSIRTLNERSESTHLPEFMKTAAFAQRIMNTQLTSWAQLRHDNLLYAKQSYTGGSICSYPYVWLEPYPELYRRLKALGTKGKNFFAGSSSIYYYFKGLEEIADSLYTIALLEVTGQPLTTQQLNWLRCIIYSVPVGSGNSPYDGWYARLYYRDHEFDYNKGLLDNDFLVADIHTVPTYCGGGHLGAVVHAGTGPINLGVFIVEQNGVPVAHVGPNFSFYEYRTLNYLRLTDQEWAQQYLWAAARPDWVNLYLADSTGSSRGAGATLLTTVESDIDIIVPVNYITAANYPNPFNPSTIIQFTIGSGFNGDVSITIYDVLGRKIKNLYQSSLSTGTYLLRWNGRDEQNENCPSGTYIYSVKTNSTEVTGKMMLIR